MQGSRKGFASPLLFAFLTVGASGIAAAQDMPPILAPLAAAPAVAPKQAPITPSAEAVIPPAVLAPAVKPVDTPHVVALAHPPTAHHNAKFSALVKHLTTAHSRLETHHAAAPHHIAETHRVAARVIEPSLPPGVPVPPPGYYEPGYGPGPYQRLVYGGPPPGPYGGWGGYRGRLPYYP
jgi:hypothetical protein